MYKEDPRVLNQDLSSKEKQDYWSLNGFWFAPLSKLKTKAEKIQ